MSRRQRGEAPPGDLSYQKGIGGIAGEVDCKEEHCVGRSRREKVEGPSREEGGVCPDLAF